MKAIKVHNCYDCPYWSAPHSTHPDDKGGCGKVSRLVKISQHQVPLHVDIHGKNINVPPDNCPLDDWETRVSDPWISVKDRLPEIPEGKHGISVLVAEKDYVYEEIHPGQGYSVFECLYMKITDKDRKRWKYNKDIEADFMTIYGGGKESFLGPTGDPIMYWMPMPTAPIREEDKNE